MIEDREEKLAEIRNDLYDALPTGNIEAWQLLEIIKKHLKKLDKLIDESTLQKQDSGVEAVEKMNDCDNWENVRELFYIENEHMISGWIVDRVLLTRYHDWLAKNYTIKPKN